MNYDEETIDFVRHGFSVYDSSMLAMSEDAHCEALFDFAELDAWLQNKTVVDVGCGVGGVLERMKRAHPNNTFKAATNCETQLSIVKSKGFQPVFCDMNEPNLPFADLFVFTQSIGHCSNLELLISHCSKKLKAGGKLLIKDFDATVPCVAETWMYRFYPLSAFVDAAKSSGLCLEKVSFPDVCHLRYLDYWNASEYMNKTHGKPYGVLARTALMLFKQKELGE
jgi:SAM-dependent methyltransferase